MCSLMGALSFAVGAAQSVLTFKAQQAQYEAQVAAYQANIQSAGQSYQDQTMAEGIKNQQQQAEAVNKKEDLYKESLRAKGQILASSEGPGVSEELLLQDIERQRADYSDIVGYNLRNEIAQSQLNMKGMQSQAETRARAGNPGPAPSSTGMWLGIGGAALGAYNQYHVTPHQDIMSHGAGASTATGTDNRWRDAWNMQRRYESRLSGGW